MGVVSGYGVGCDRLWQGLQSGRSAVTRVERFITDGLRSDRAVLVPDATPNQAMGSQPTRDLCLKFACTAGREALAAAGLLAGDALSPDIPAHRVALVLGTTLSDRHASLSCLSEATATALGIQGPQLGVTTACSSSSNAIGVGCELLHMGAADYVLAGGTGALSPESMAGFGAVGVLSPTVCAPFSEQLGTTLGEGAGFFLLARSSTVEHRPHRSLGCVLGYGLSSDAYHPTAPDPRGHGVGRAITSALSHAGLTPDQVEYVNAHGTGTQANDAAEWRGLVCGLGPQAEAIPVSSTKGHFGHALGAAGILEGITTMLCMHAEVVPPSLNFVRPRPGAPPDPVPGPELRAHQYDVAVSNSAGFGGANAALCLGRRIPAAHRPANQRHRGLRVLGLGALGGFGRGPQALLDQGFDGVSDRVEQPRIDWRTLTIPRGGPGAAANPAHAFLCSAALDTLQDAGLPFQGQASERRGLFVGMTLSSRYPTEKFFAQLERHGLARPSVKSFSHLLMNSVTGECSRRLGLGAASSTLVAGQISGLVAVIQAAQYLTEHPDLELLLCAGVDEATVPAQLGCDASAACLALAPLTVATAGTPPLVELRGWGLAGPGRVETAVEQALDAAQITADEVQEVFSMGPIHPKKSWAHTRLRRICHDDGQVAAARSAQLCVAAAQRLRAGAPGPILVTACGETAVSGALVFDRAATLTDP